MKRIFPFIVIVGALALVGFGCNSVQNAQRKVSGATTTTQAVKHATSGQFEGNIKNDQHIFKDDKTGKTYVEGADVKLPDNFPKDTPIYPGSTISAAIVSPSLHSAGATISSLDDAQKTGQWYTDQMKNNGWKEKQHFASGSTEYRTYNKGLVDIKVTIIPDSDTGGTVISIARYRIDL